jgi:hypothetical protein
MKDIQREMNSFYEQYNTVEDVDVEDELNQLAAEMENDTLPVVTNGNNILIISKLIEKVPDKVIMEKKPVTASTTSKVSADERKLDEFLMD